MRWNRCIENKSIGDILEIVKNVKKGYISYIPHNIGRINSTSGAGPGEMVVPCSSEVKGKERFWLRAWLSTLRLWTSCLSSLSLSLCICKMGIMIYLPYWAVARVIWLCSWKPIALCAWQKFHMYLFLLFILFLFAMVSILCNIFYFQFHFSITAISISCCTFFFLTVKALS